MNKIMPNRLDRGFYLYQEEFEQKALEVLRSGWYILGGELSALKGNSLLLQVQNTAWGWPAAWMRSGSLSVSSESEKAMR